MDEEVIQLHLIKKKIRNLLRCRQRNSINDDRLIPAAVLVPLFDNGGDVNLLLIKRSRHVKTHPYQISFPGGVLDHADRDLDETALRETFEEVGIDRSCVEILGPLDDYATISNYCITPYVGVIPSLRDLRVNRREVEAIIDIPLRSLCDARYEKILSLAEGKKHTYIYRSGPFTIWGATARILKDFLDIFKELKG